MAKASTGRARWTAAGLAVVVAGLVGLQGPSAQAQDPDGTLTFSPSSGTYGTRITFTVTGCGPGGLVFAVGDRVYGYFRDVAGGTFTATVDGPRANEGPNPLPPGTHQTEVACEQQPAGYFAKTIEGGTFTLLPTPTTTSTSTSTSTTSPDPSDPDPGTPAGRSDLTISPTSGPPGTPVTVEITGCPNNRSYTAQQDFEVYPFLEGTSPGSVRISGRTSGGRFRDTVPFTLAGTGGPDLPVQPGNTYIFELHCVGPNVQRSFFVTEPPAATSSTSTSTTTAAGTSALGSASAERARPGDAITVSGGGFGPGSSGVIDFASTPVRVGSFQADATGRVVETVRIPANATVGQHHVLLQGTSSTGERHVVSIPVTIVSRGLPRTGAGGTTALVGAALIGLGLVVVGRSMHRRPSLSR